MKKMKTRRTGSRRDICILWNEGFKADEMAGGRTGAQADSLCSVPRTRMVERENPLPWVVL